MVLSEKQTNKKDNIHVSQRTLLPWEWAKFACNSPWAEEQN